jgi:hypothetical protein
MFITVNLNQANMKQTENIKRALYKSINKLKKKYANTKIHAAIKL